MKQINIKFNENNEQDMAVYNKIKTDERGMTEYIRQLVLMDIIAEEMVRIYMEGAMADGEKD